MSNDTEDLDKLVREAFMIEAEEAREAALAKFFTESVRGVDTKKSNHFFVSLAIISYISGILFGYQDCDIPNVFFSILGLLSLAMIIYCICCYVKNICIRSASLFTSIISIAPAARLLFNIIFYNYDPFEPSDHLFIPCNPFFTYFSDDIPERTDEALEKITKALAKTQ